MSGAVLFDTPGPRAKRNIRIANFVGAAIATAIVVAVLWRLGAMGQLEASRWSPLVTSNAWVNFFIPGLKNTLLAAVFAVVFALIFGMVFGLGRLAPFAVVRWISGTIVEFFRAVPVLIMMIALWLGLARSGLVPPQDSPLIAVVVALTLYNGSVIAELVRSGVHGLPKGQREAGAAIGMTHSQSLRLVELPQALIAMLPSLVSQFVIILKDSALGQIITFNEFLEASRRFGAGNSMLPALVLCAAVFILMNWLLTKLADRIAKRLQKRTSGKTTPTAALPAQGADDEAPALA